MSTLSAWYIYIYIYIYTYSEVSTVEMESSYALNVPVTYTQQPSVLHGVEPFLVGSGESSCTDVDIVTIWFIRTNNVSSACKETIPCLNVYRDFTEHWIKQCDMIVTTQWYWYWYCYTCYVLRKTTTQSGHDRSLQYCTTT